MLDFFATLYAAMQVTAILMAWPQIRKLYIAKQSSELSLTTWVTWLMSSLITIEYAYLTAQPVWMLANIGWSSFYLAMVVLIIRYRKQTIYEQMVHLFNMRFYFSIGKSAVKSASRPKHVPQDLLEKLQHNNSDQD